MSNNNSNEIFGNVISSYSRSQAIADGFLVDVTTVAAEAGIRFPVALIRAAWEDCVSWTAEDEKRKGFTGNSDAGRLWDVLFMAAMAMRRAGDGQEMNYNFYRIPREGKGRKPRMVTLKLHIGPGDTAAPVITIMQPNED